VESAGSGDDGHGDQVYGVLDGGNLYLLAYHSQSHTWGYGQGRTIKLLTKICKILAFKLVRPAKIFCRIPMRTWPMGALMNIP
jgi:hypothetical protein